VIRYDKLRTDVGTFTFDLKKQEIVKLDSTAVSIGTRAAATPFRRQSNQCISSNGGSSERLPSASPNDSPSHVFQPGEETAGLESNGITGSDSVSMGEGADEEDVVVVLRVPPDNQDEGLDDSRAAEEILHVLRDSPNQHQGVGMETTRCQPSNETGVQMEMQH
uniref:hypothetical protein n=1 Tax=Thiolapillus sp. TaxID=2017437 RepID=UPI003AF85C4B